MGKCLIFCAGGFAGLLEPPSPEDCILAADGGYRHAQGLGLKPREVLGDFDSLGYVPEDATVFPREKDDTDSMLAIRRGLSMGFREFVIYGGLDGDRLEHTVANLQALRYLADHGAKGTLVGIRQLATVVQNGTLTFPKGHTGYLSLFCMGPDATGVTLSGLKYTLENGVLTGGFPLGTSNQFIGADATVTVQKGILLAIWDR